jgi:hypothetical protein
MAYVGDDKKKTELFLVEKVLDGKLEPVGLFTRIEKVKEVLKDSEGIATQMVVNAEYSEGIGVCPHIYFAADGSINGPDITKGVQ